jgi:hypothetical protein
VSDAYVTLEWSLVQLALERGQFAHTAPDGNSTVVADGRDAGAIIATILQALETFQDNRRGLARADVTYNTTHGNPS